MAVRPRLGISEEELTQHVEFDTLLDEPDHWMVPPGGAPRRHSLLSLAAALCYQFVRVLGRKWSGLQGTDQGW
jgi:hypothetical protein